MQPTSITLGSNIGRAAAAALLAAVGGAAATAEPTVPDVVNSFMQLAHHPDPMAIGIGVGGDATICKHYQGINRHDAPDGTPYFLLSRSGNRASCVSSNDPGELAVARLGSRPTHGERLRSNRLAYNIAQKDTPPPAGDEIVTSLRFDGVSTDVAGRTIPAWMHLGGMQIIDDVLVIPAEDEYPDGSDTGAVLFFDISDPENPRLLHEVRLGYKIGVLAITRYPGTDEYLIVVSGGNTERLYFFETNAGCLTAGSGCSLQIVDIWERDDIDVPDATENSWEKWQTINFVRQDDGTLYMIGVDNTTWTDQGEGHVTKLYRVTRSGDNFNFVFEAERTLKLDDPRTGNGAAGSGVYISPMGELMMYTCEHDNDGPQNSIRAGELRSYDVSAYSGGLDMSSDYWIELYWDDTGWSESSPNRSLMLDECDFHLENWEALDLEDGWGNEADSLRFYAPSGRDICLFREPNFGGAMLRLQGNGSVQSIPDLDDEGFGDSIESVFIGRYRVPFGFEVSGLFNNLRAFSNAISYNGSRGLVFVGTSNIVLNMLQADPGETVLLEPAPGVTTLLTAP
jgi:hypothetical protein